MSGAWEGRPAGEALAGYLQELLAEGPEAETGAAPGAPEGAAAAASEAAPEDPGRHAAEMGGQEGLWWPFRVGALWLAVPAERVRESLPADQVSTGAPVVHPAPLVFPEGHPGRELPPGRWRLLLRDGRALACDEAGPPGRLEEVLWRRERRSRPWLLGTASRPRWALVDLDALTWTAPRGAPAGTETA